MTTTTPQRPSHRRALSRWARIAPLALALALLTGMVAPGGARPAAADGGPTICGTLNTPACPSSPSSPSSPQPLLDDSLLNPVDNGLLKAPDTRFSATAAQITALHALEQEAVADNLTFHGLSTDDANAVSTWGRYDADADLFLLLQQAALTPPISRTQVQSDAVAWLTAVLQRNDVQAEQDAGREYVKWAGLDEVHYNALLSQHADAGTLANFFTRGTGNPDPANFYTQQDGTQTGYCNYVPPATDTNNNTYSDSSNQTCFVPCQSSAGCIPFGPTTNDFIKWGTVDSTNPDLTNPQYQANAVGVAAGVGLAAVAGVGVGIAGLVGLSVAAGGAAVAAVSASAGLAVSTGALGLIFPFTAAAGGTIVGGAIAGAILVPIIAIVTGAFYAVDLFQSDQVPGNLASVIAAGPPPVDLGAAFQDTQQTAALYSLFIAALAPSASFPAIPDPATPDPFFAVFPKGALTNTTSYTTSISVVDAAAATTTTARLHETWFIEQASGSGTTPVAEQTLRLHYTDWAGNEQTAWLLPPQAGHGYRFLTAQEVPSSGSFNPATCLTDKTCALTDTIDYVGPDGADYSAQVLPALPPIPKYTVGASPTEGSPVTFDASSSVSLLELPLTDQWRFEQVLPPGTTPINLCFFDCGPVNPYANYTAPVSGARVSYTWPRSGTYGVLLTETDSWGKVTTVTGTVTVADVPPALTLSPAPPAPASSPITLTGVITHAGSLDTERVTVNWGDGSPTDTNVFNDPNGSPVIVIVNGNSVPPAPALNPISGTLLGVSDTHTYAAPGVYTATVRVTDQAGATSSATATEIVGLQTITFAPPPAHTYGDAPFTVTATGGGSGNPVTFSAGPATVCASGGTNGATITPVGVGTCTVTASQAGAGNYQAAPNMAQSFMISYPPLYLTLGITSSPAGPVTTGSVVTVTGTLSNHTTAAEAVTLKATFSYVSPSGQRSAISGSSRSFTLAAGRTLGQPFSFTISKYVPRGAYTVALTATDNVGDTASSSITLTVV